MRKSIIRKPDSRPLVSLKQNNIAFLKYIGEHEQVFQVGITWKQLSKLLYKV